MTEKEIREVLNNSKEVFLFGKGKVGKLFLKWLRIYQCDANVLGFVVSCMDEETICMDKMVIDLETFKSKYHESLIVVCVAEKDRQGIIESLHNYKLTNYIILSDEMIGSSLYRLESRSALRFEVHVTEHCNLNCRGCTHFSPLAEEEFLSIEEYERDCKRLSELYQDNLEYIELLGGEPLLHQDIIEFFKVSRKYFKRGRITLVTNGILLPKMSEEFWIATKRYDIEISPTCYPINVDYEGVKRKAEKFGVTYRPFDMITDKKGKKVLENYHLDIEGKQPEKENFDKCCRGNFCITLRHGKMYSCVLGANLHHFKKFFGMEEIEISEENGIDIYSVTDAAEIADFLAKPMPVCKYCKLLDEKTFIPFEISKRDMAEWL